MNTQHLDREYIIRCEGLSLGYGREVILDNVFLDIPRGVFLPFIGPNGAGKTTLLRGIVGLLKPLRGRLRTPFEALPPGYVPQQESIDPLFPMTVREIVSMGFYPRLRYWGRPSPADNRMLEATLEELRLTEYARKNYRELSGGTKQKTLMARALVSGAEVFILDEPTSELDDASQKQVMDHLLRFVREQKKTVLMAHHGVDNLGSYASQVCLVDHGKVSLVASDRAKGLFSRGAA